MRQTNPLSMMMMMLWIHSHVVSFETSAVKMKYFISTLSLSRFNFKPMQTTTTTTIVVLVHPKFCAKWSHQWWMWLNLGISIDFPISLSLFLNHNILIYINETIRKIHLNSWGKKIVNVNCISHIKNWSRAAFQRNFFPTNDIVALVVSIKNCVAVTFLLMGIVIK